MQLLPTSLVLFALASEGVAGGARAVIPDGTRPLLEQPRAARTLTRLPLVPDWRHWLQLAIPRGPMGLMSKPGAAPERRLQLRWVYRRLVELPELDRVGRFARVEVLLAGLSGGPELLRLAPRPPREDYARAQEITPGWSWWYVRAERWGVGLAAGTRFLVSDHAGTIVDPFTSQARWAFFLP